MSRLNIAPDALTPAILPHPGTMSAWILKLPFNPFSIIDSPGGSMKKTL